MTVMARVTCQEVNPNADTLTVEVKFSAVPSDDPNSPNLSYASDNDPLCSIRIAIDNVDEQATFIIGNNYDIVFTPV